MASVEKYRRRKRTIVSAVRVMLDTSGFDYHKWGDTQHCKPGDWLVDNGGDIYTIDADTFTRTYHEISPGRYEKISNIWAERAETAGSIRTLEGTTHYQAGDYIVYNDDAKTDAYAVPATHFDELYEAISDSDEEST